MPLFNQISLLFLLAGSEALTHRHDADSISTSQECCNAIRTYFASIVHGPGSSDYNDRLSSYYSQQQHDYYPTCYVKPKYNEDISQILKIAASHHCQFAVASGGHMAWAEASNTGDGFVLDLRDMNRIDISVDQQTVSLGPGSKWINVYKAMDAHNLTVPGARMSDVGVGGFLAGGGYPFTSKTPGFGANSVFNYEVVLSDGTIVEANADSHSGLFWALKLAGTNYGIITRFDMNADASTEIWGAVGLYPSTEQTRTKIFPAYEEYSHRNDNTDLFISVGHLKAMGRNMVMTCVVNSAGALNPQPSSASHGCSCFSGSYLATASTFTSTVTAPAVTKTSQTIWRTEISTATVIVTITSETTVLGRSSSSSSSSLSPISTSSVPSLTSTPPAITTTSVSYTTITTYPVSCDATRSAIPVCASTCLSSAAVTQARCGADDTICLCQNQQVIQGAGTNCFIGACGFGGAIVAMNSISSFISCEQQGLYTTTAPVFPQPVATTTSTLPAPTD